MALDAMLAGGDPAGHHVRSFSLPSSVVAKIKYLLPYITASVPIGKCGSPVRCSQIASYRVPLVSVHPSLALFQVHWITRKIPVYDSMAPRMEVKTFLTNRSAC